MTITQYCNLVYCKSLREFIVNKIQSQVNFIDFNFSVISCDFEEVRMLNTDLYHCAWEVILQT